MVNPDDWICPECDGDRVSNCPTCDAEGPCIECFGTGWNSEFIDVDAYRAASATKDDVADYLWDKE